MECRDILNGLKNNGMNLTDYIIMHDPRSHPKIGKECLDVLLQWYTLEEFKPPYNFLGPLIRFIMFRETNLLLRLKDNI